MKIQFYIGIGLIYFAGILQTTPTWLNILMDVIIAFSAVQIMKYQSPKFRRDMELK